jgi:hypothetical protein
MDDVLAFAQRALYDDMSQFVKLYAHAAPADIETAGETNGAPGASAEAEDDKYEAPRLKYTQLKLAPPSRGARTRARRFPLVGRGAQFGTGNAPARRGRRRPLRGRARSPRSARGPLDLWPKSAASP